MSHANARSAAHSRPGEYRTRQPPGQRRGIRQRDVAIEHSSRTMIMPSAVRLGKPKRRRTMAGLHSRSGKRLGSARASRAVVGASPMTFFDRTRESFRQGAEIGTRGACAPQKKRRVIAPRLDMATRNPFALTARYEQRNQRVACDLDLE